jgi:L-ascorbate metabolism protein UlaG (beta-lactamase superfamily)
MGFKYQDNTIHHLYHSGFLLKRDGIVMIFDYAAVPEKSADGTGLDAGAIFPDILADEEVYVFASHSHMDHFQPVIFDWRQHVKNIHYVMSYDIPDPPSNAIVFRPGEEKEVGRIRVRAYSATDAGLAYSIYIGGRHIYFAGDNAFWNWDGDLDEEIYHRIALAAIDRETPMDIAFQVCDPRLDGKGDGGLYIFARTFQPGLLVPIHAFGQYAFNTVAEKRLRDAGFANRFWCVSRNGEMLSIPK